MGLFCAVTLMWVFNKGSMVGTVLEKQRNWIKVTYIHIIIILMSVQDIK